ncbi:MAG: NADH-quinone oxidoreductase subunit H [Chloroflexi bacterium]|nr:NADH-quinone oxidoreductase subunit H [Chloroflexota bacterium]
MTLDASAIIFTATGFIFAPLLFGIINKTKAFVGGRTGAPFLQPYFDLIKLMQKGGVYSVTTGWIFTSAPAVVLASVGVVMLLVPLATSGAVFSFNGDIFLFAGLLAFARLAMILAAMDTGSAFEGMGASREAMISAISEPGLLLMWVALAVITGQFSVEGMLGGDLNFAWSSAAGPAIVLLLVALFLLMLAENARIPVDDPTTHLELTMVHEVMILDHSGPDLGFLTYAAALKLWIFAALLVNIVLSIYDGPLWATATIFGVGMVLTAIAVALVESTMARLRMIQVPELLTIAVGLSAMSAAIALGVR